MQAYPFLKECGTFWVTTIDKAPPASRPFGAVTEHGGELYISTSDTKAVYKQLKTNPAVQLTAINPVRANGYGLTGRRSKRRSPTQKHRC